MKGGNKCKNCGGGEIDTDPARGDAVCTNCGSVVESSIIVSTVQFEERAGGSSSVLGQFVSSDSKGAPRGLGSNFQTGYHVESREITLSKAKKKITQLAQILRINQTCIDMAFNFFKMALNRQLTRGRRSENVIGACLYMTCRLEGTPHMLIDFCDALDITSVYSLGRTFLRLSQTLCIRLPTPDPSLYVLRFAGALNFGNMTHTVTITALRLIARMKRDSIHHGRHASGLCGAALLLAARLHEYNRSVSDIVNIVKVHESTLRKRLIEFGETPSSHLSLDEFMTVDLEDEQDPPSFRAARKKDRGLANLKIPNNEEIDSRFAALQVEIEKELTKTRSKSTQKQWMADLDAIDTITMDATLDAVSKAMDDEHIEGIPPTYENLRLDRDSENPEVAGESSDDLDDLDDDELNNYILSAEECKFKNQNWMQSNADFLEKEKERAEIKKVKEAAKPDKKRRKYLRRGPRNQPMGSAFEAMEKMLQEKKLSTKINYEVLKNLTLPDVKPKEEEKFVKPGPSGESSAKKRKVEVDEVAIEDVDEEIEDETDEVPAENTEMSLADLLSQHRNDDDDDEYGPDLDEEDY